MDKYFLYILEIKVSGRLVYKLGYSSNIGKRIKNLSRLEDTNSLVKGKGLVLQYIKCIDSLEMANLTEAKKQERKLIRKNDKFRYIGSNLLPNGNTELFNKQINLL